jgi:hypothetical protein
VTDEEARTLSRRRRGDPTEEGELVAIVEDLEVFDFDGATRGRSTGPRFDTRRRMVESIRASSCSAASCACCRR